MCRAQNSAAECPGSNIQVAMQTLGWANDERLANVAGAKIATLTDQKCQWCYFYSAIDKQHSPVAQSATPMSFSPAC
jgi:hypothetical protein